MKKLLSKNLNNNIQIIDIRDEEYYIGWKNSFGISGHIPNAIDFPIAWLDFDKDKLNLELKRKNIDKNKKTVIYSDESITKEEYNKYINLGFTDLYILNGGIKSYVKINKNLNKLKNYDMYVSPRWVQALLDDKNPEKYNGKTFKIIEVSLPNEVNEYSSGHIKTALNVSSDDINDNPGELNLDLYSNIDSSIADKFWQIPDNNKIKEVLENLGIDKDTLVILYGTEKATIACFRAAFIMEYVGVKNIKVINGGKKLWKLENRKLETKINISSKSNFGTIENKNSILITYDEELKLINDENSVIASVRSIPEYMGKTTGYSYIDKLGDIKNSRFAHSGSNPYAMEDYRNIDNTLFNYEICKDRWEKWGITKNKKISFHCGTGWRASEAYYLAKALGYENIGVYAGGWYEWIRKENSLIKKSGIPNDSPNL
ncbi:rhodanese-like domain-containing protein [Oceanivirga salmonicida]|uniref:rhodanese-like domain-containing protein n=1 Tax=Oceanivirga salmonicida TaxID=1769291 RepID=UPI0012E258E1|nr:rhodanese-like domain-containing protein [Oceanivirga salmonicida]